MIKRSALFTTLSLILILILPVLAGCSRTTPQTTTPTITPTTTPPEQETQPPEVSNPVDELDGSQWKLITLNNGPPISDSYISLYFRNGTFWGYSGLNTYGAEYTIQDTNTLVFSDGMVTLLGGPDDIMRQEQAYLKYFHDAVSFQKDGNQLKIFNAENPEPLVFERLPEYPMNFTDLVGTKWQCVSLNGEQIAEELSITLNFGDTSASGQAGCFDYELPYETRAYKPAGDDIRWGMSCRRTGELSPELEQQAGHYTSSILWAANFLLTRDKLELYTARGETIVFRPLAQAETDG